MVTLIDPKDAFVHIVYDYRCLVRAEFGFRESAKNSEINNLVPEIGTIARNAVLSKARSLVDFYTKPRPRDTDITFNGSLQTVDNALFTKLEGIRNSMEVHDLHLTVWRDSTYRSGQSNAARQRIDWDAEQANIVNDLLSALKVSAPSLGVKWEEAFMRLHDAALDALNNGAQWDEDLTDSGHIVAYLESLGL